MSSAGQPRVLAGRYRLDDVIGRGGMSTVYRATDLSLDRVVAVKVALDPLVEQSAVYLARFTREAQATAALSDPAVVTVYDAGADGPTRYIVMEYVRGQSLAELMQEREREPLEPQSAAQIGEQVARALSAAHAADIVHRDIKPGNIMIADDGSVKVLDFGIARALDGQTLTRTATVLGTSAYMSPEQALGNPADSRSDVYSLGCVLYEMLTGEPPFAGDTSPAVLHQHVRVAPKPARERNPAVPAALDALVMQMLAKAPDDRPQTAAEVRDRLAQAAGDPDGASDALTTVAMAALVPTPATVPIEVTGPADATVPLTPRRATPPSPEQPRQATPSPPPPSKSTRGFWITVAVIAAVLLGGAVAVALTGGGSAVSTSSSTSQSTPAGGGSSHTTTHGGTTPSAPSHATSTSTPHSSTSKSTPTSTSKSTSTPISTSKSTSTPASTIAPPPPTTPSSSTQATPPTTSANSPPTTPTSP